MKVELIVFDWAGTLIDCGSRAPVLAFTETFAQFGVDVTEAEARAPMGMPKRPHIAEMLADPAIAARWAAAQGPADEAAIDRLYAAFEPIAAEVAAREAAPIPGVPEALEALRSRGIKIGSTTGYARSIMAKVLPKAAAAGVAPDCIICADEVARGRPAGDGVLDNMAHFGLSNAKAVIKLDDAAPGILEGVNAGARAIGVTVTGNGAGQSAEVLAKAAPDDIARLREIASPPLLAAGAEAVIDGVANLPDLISEA